MQTTVSWRKKLNLVFLWRFLDACICLYFSLQRFNVSVELSARLHVVLLQMKRIVGLLQAWNTLSIF